MRRVFFHRFFCNRKKNPSMAPSSSLTWTQTARVVVTWSHLLDFSSEGISFRKESHENIDQDVGTIYETVTSKGEKKKITSFFMFDDGEGEVTGLKSEEKVKEKNNPVSRKTIHHLPGGSYTLIILILQLENCVISTFRTLQRITPIYQWSIHRNINSTGLH